MSSTLKDVADILVSLGHGAIGDTLFLGGDAPPSPDVITILRVTGSLQPTLPTIDLRYTSLEMVTRAKRGDIVAANEYIDGLTTLLHSVVNVTINDSRYLAILQQNGPTGMGFDVTMRPMFSSEFLCIHTSV
jgi:hypothetical protein